MAADEARQGFLGFSDGSRGVPPAPLFAYVVLWIALAAYAVAFWPDAVEGLGWSPLPFVPLLIAFHLSKGSTTARGWGLVFHGALAAGATALALTHAVLSEADPVVIGFAVGTWVVGMLFAQRLRLPFVVTRRGLVAFSLVALYAAWVGFQTASAARWEFPQVELRTPAPWQSSDRPPRAADLSSFTDAPTLIAFGERNGVSWAFYTYPERDGSESCLALTENARLLAGSCPLDFVAPDHRLGLIQSEAESGDVVYGAVSRSVRGLELRFEGGRAEAIRIVEPPPEAGLDANVYFAFLPENADRNSWGISAFDAEGERIDEAGSFDTP